MDCFASLAMTVSKHESTPPRRDAPGSCKNLPPMKDEGVGNAGCPMHPQPLGIGSKHRVVTTVAPESPGIPAREWF
jgi:hypothetical protein